VISIMRNRHLITLGIAKTVSGAGNWITMMVVFSILIFEGGGDVWQNSGILLVGLLTTLLGLTTPYPVKTKYALKFDSYHQKTVAF